MKEKINYNFIDKVCILGANGCIGSFMKASLLPYSKKIIEIDPSFEKLSGFKYNLDVRLASEKTKMDLFSDVSVFIFSVKESLLFQLLENILPYVTNKTLLVDTTSIKCKVEQQYKEAIKAFEQKPQILSIDPLFKPGVGIGSKTIAYFALNKGVELDNFLKILEAAELQLFESDPSEHDQALSINQVMVHALLLAFGKSLLNTNITFETLLKYSTPPFRLLLFILNRVLSGVPEVYWDIQANNYFSNNAREDLKSNLSMLQKMVKDDDISSFYELIDQIKSKTIGINKNGFSEIFNEVNVLVENFLNSVPEKNLVNKGDSEKI